MKPVVMLPTYNERDNIEDVIADVLGQDARLSVVVVDDESPDGTGDVVAKLAQDDERVHLVSRKDERGRASAGLAGFRWAIDNGFDVVVEMDADGSHDPKYLSDFLAEIEGFDVVVGSRYLPGGGSLQDRRIQHHMSRLANVFNNLVLGLDLADSSGGYKCYTAKALKAIGLDGYVSSGYSIGAEILFRCKRAGLRMKEIPIVFRPRASGESKLSWKIILSYPLTILRLRLSG